jgi:hypothetical protein
MTDLFSFGGAGIAFVPYFPLGGGRADLEHPAMAQVADRHHATTAQSRLGRTEEDLANFPGGLASRT